MPPWRSPPGSPLRLTRPMSATGSATGWRNQCLTSPPSSTTRVCGSTSPWDHAIACGRHCAARARRRLPRPRWPGCGWSPPAPWPTCGSPTGRAGTGRTAAGPPHPTRCWPRRGTTVCPSTGAHGANVPDARPGAGTNRRRRSGGGYPAGLPPARAGPGDEVSGAEAHEPADAVDPVVVAGDHDVEQREQRIGDGQGPQPAAADERRQHEGAPCRPADVHAGHRRVLVGDRGHLLAAERRPAAELGHRVDVAEVVARRLAGLVGQVLAGGVDLAAAELARVVEEAGRHQRERGEPDEGQEGGERQRVAPQPVALGRLAEQPYERGTRHHEVEDAVVDVPEPDQTVERQVEVPALQSVLEVEADVALKLDDGLGVVVRRLRVNVVAGPRPELVSHGGIGHVDEQHVDDLAPPPQPEAPPGRDMVEPVVDRAHVAATVRRGRPPAANAGAPSRLTARMSRYSSRPSAIASSLATPSGPRKSTNAPSRTPSPDMLIGSTWAMSTAGKKASRAVRPAGRSPSACAAATAANT